MQTDLTRASAVDLAARLTGLRVDIKSETQMREEESRVAAEAEASQAPAEEAEEIKEPVGEGEETTGD